MKIIVLQDDLYSYIKHVIVSYAGQGISPEEGMAIYHLNNAVSQARSVDPDQIAKMSIKEMNKEPDTQTEKSA